MTVPIVETTQSTQTLRTERTRAALLSAAEKIFARDGFEAARIEEIAAEAGRTRGAFYAHFESKTDVFLALRSDMMRRKARIMKERLGKLASDELPGDAVRRYMLEQLCDPEHLILQIEFKLFALRHPLMLAELAEKHLDAMGSINEQELPELFPEDGDNQTTMRRNTLAVEAILEGFGLNSSFSAEVLTRSYLEEKIPVLLTHILPNFIGDK